MLGDGTIGSTIGSWWGKVRPQAARRDKSPPNDPMFIDVMADFSRKLGERVARQSAGGLAAAQQERREAMKAYDRARRRQQILTAGVAVGALIALGIASLAPPVAPPVAAPPAVAAAPVEPAPPVMVAAAQPTVLPDTTPVAPAPEPAPSSAATPSHARHARAVARRGGAGSPKAPARLRLQSGPADGVAGRMTANAVMGYQQSRGQAQTGDIDRDLLDQLRLDPAPQVAPPQRTAQRTRTQAAARRASPLDQFGRWIDSLVR